MSKASLRQLYSELPGIDCQRKCQEFCGVIEMTREEWERIIKHLGYAPRGNPRTLVCPMLTADGRCSVYQLRPLICRLWGVVEGMKCPYGCQPNPDYLSNDEAFVFLVRSGAMDGRTYSKEEAEAFLGQRPPEVKWEMERLANRGSIPPIPPLLRPRP
jgi:Fe-S-cluster containining protein